MVNKSNNIDEFFYTKINRRGPFIYAFEIEPFKNCLKIGDTDRSVQERLNEWRDKYHNLIEKYQCSAKINQDEDVYFRDYAIHKYLKAHKKRHLKQTDFGPNIYFSNEFYEADTKDIDNAIYDIKKAYKDGNRTRYAFYTSDNKEKEYTSCGLLTPREPMQTDTIEKFLHAYKNGHKNFLMYAVMRFGKSFTAMCCADAIKAKFVLVVSAKGDVSDEWQRAVQTADNFNGKQSKETHYNYINKKKLKYHPDIIKTYINQGERVLLFLTLQDLQGENIKTHHKELFETDLDMLIVDETHFGARAKNYGKIITNKKEQDLITQYDKEDYIDTEIAKKETENIKKVLNPKATIHLSGTPYRILMGNEFEKDEIIAFYQYADIIKEKENWDINNSQKKEKEKEEDWENPYYGFPKMIRFAFNLNSSSRKLLNEYKAKGITYKLSSLFEPQSIQKNSNGKHKKFVHEKEVLDFLKSIDSSNNDKNVLGFLDIKPIQNAEMCRHIVIVLPHCASCDAMEELINKNKKIFKNLKQYELINISGVDKSITNTEEIKESIKNYENKNKKTITLTVNRMLTGSTVKEWDTMIYLKDTSSPQEYDQAIFRLQSPYIKTYRNKSEIIKRNMKPQTLLVDFDPNRMFLMQAIKSQIYNENIEKHGISQLENRLETELKISPIIRLSEDGLEEITPQNIIDAISDYSKDRGIMDTIGYIPVDLSLMLIPEISETILQENELGSNKGLAILNANGDGSNMQSAEIQSLDPGILNNEEENLQVEETRKINKNLNNESLKSLENKFRAYYARILFFAFLTKDKIKSLDELLQVFDKKDNFRIAKNLHLDKNILTIFHKKINKNILPQLELQILNVNNQSRDVNIDNIESILKQFGKLGVSEVITPSNICDKMIYNISDKDFIDMVKSKRKIIDIASKEGEFAISIYKRCLKLGLKEEDIYDLIYSVTTSSVAYEFTKKVYNLLNLNTDNIAKHFTSYSLLNIKKSKSKIDYDKIVKILNTKQKFSDINLSNIELNNEDNSMKFQAVVGNPPYQGKNHQQIYPDFFLISQKLGEIVSLIFPTGWQEPKNANNLRKLNNDDVKKDKQIVFIDNVHKAFPNMPGAEWTNIVLWKKGHDNGLNGKQNIYTNGKALTKTELFIKEQKSEKPQELLKLAECVKNKEFKSIREITSTRKPYGLCTNVFNNPEIEPLHKTQQKIDDIKIYANKASGSIIWGPKNYKFPVKNPALKKYKVFIPYAWGNMDEKKYLGGAFADIIIGSPNEATTETYIESGCFDTKEQAKNHAKYLMTQFARALLYVNKTSRHSTTAWDAIPLQDYSEAWWKKSIKDIDKELMEKYAIPQNIQEFVYKNIQPKTEKNITNYKD